MQGVPRSCGIFSPWKRCSSIYSPPLSSPVPWSFCLPWWKGNWHWSFCNILSGFAIYEVDFMKWIMKWITCWWQHVINQSTACMTRYSQLGDNEVEIGVFWNIWLTYNGPHRANNNTSEGRKPALLSWTKFSWLVTKYENEIELSHWKKSPIRNLPPVVCQWSLIWAFNLIVS